MMQQRNLDQMGGWKSKGSYGGKEETQASIGRGFGGLLKESVSEPSGMNRNKELKHAKDFVEL